MNMNFTHLLLPLLSSPFIIAWTTEAFSVSKSIGRRSSRNTDSALFNIPRRQVLGGALTGGASVLTSGDGRADASTITKDLLADLPMVRLKLPQGGLGREYVAVKLKINGEGPFDFMLDSGLTTELITPHLQTSLGIATGKDSILGLGAGGGGRQELVDLNGVSLCCGDFVGHNELQLPNLHAVITDFPQEHIDPAHDPVEGMLGMEMLSQFDCDFDFPNNIIRFWKPGTADKSGMVEIPAVVINETGLIGVRVSIPGIPQPVLGFLDCGASFSCMNWKAAEVLGLPPKTDSVYTKGPAIQAVGVDGRPLLLPAIKEQLTFVGDAQQDPETKRPTGFATPPKEWKPWKPVLLAVGDIPAFSTILGDGRTPFQGPAALIGLDVLAQRRVILEAGTGNSRRRRVFVSPD